MTPALNTFRNAGIALLALAACSYTASVGARPRVMNNWGPDQYVTCAAIIPGSGTPGYHQYAWWNPNWPAPHNTAAYAVGICNQWHGGANSVDIPPAVNTAHTGPHQWSPPAFNQAVQASSGVKNKDLQTTAVTGSGVKSSGSSTAVDATATQAASTTKP